MVEKKQLEKVEIRDSASVTREVREKKYSVSMADNDLEGAPGQPYRDDDRYHL